MCHAFRLTKRDDYFRVTLDHFWSEHYFYEGAGAVSKIGLSLNPNHHNQVKLFQILDTLCKFQTRFRRSGGSDDDLRPQGSEKQGPLEMFQVRLLHRVLRLLVACQDRKIDLVWGQAVSHQVITSIGYKIAERLFYRSFKQDRFHDSSKWPKTVLGVTSCYLKVCESVQKNLE